MRKRHRHLRRQLPPGTITRRVMPILHYELFVCGFRGHVLAGFGGDPVESDPHLVREYSDTSWHRCLRCDAWIPITAHDALPAHVRARSHDREKIVLPLRGRALRDKIVLRIIAIDRGIHFIVLAALALAIFLIASHHSDIREKFYKVAKALQPAVNGGEQRPHHGVVGLIEDVLKFDTSSLYLFGIAILIYGLIEGAEAVGLWMQKRWAEYLTFIATTLFVPYEIYEIISKVSYFKIGAFTANILILVYLLFAKRLFGLRGGDAAVHELYAKDQGWPAIERVTPPHEVGDIVDDSVEVVNQGRGKK